MWSDRNPTPRPPHPPARDTRPSVFPPGPESDTLGVRPMSQFVRAFPLWVTLCGVAALIQPEAFTWFRGSMITYGLMVIMLGMGLTLELPDFRRVFRRPKPILMGVVLQFVCMPALGFTSAKLFGLAPELAMGLVLVSCCPGGTASNVIAYIGRCDVALSVSMTSISTLLAVIATPLLTSALASSAVDVDALGLLRGTASVVLLPVAIGLLLRRYAPRLTSKLLVISPALAVVMIILIVGSILGGQREHIISEGIRLFTAIVVTHTAGFVLAHYAARGLGATRLEARTISIEVGMQNSGLGVVLARNNFSSPLVALPCAISSVVHCILGSIAAAWFAAHAVRD